MELALSVLGTPRLERDGIAVNIQRRKVMALLVYMAISGESHSRDELAALFWPDENQTSARASLRRTVSELNQIIGKRVVKCGDGLVLSSAPDFWLDSSNFRQRLQMVKAHAHPPGEACAHCIAAIDEAATLYRADFLSGFSLKDSAVFDHWIRSEAENLRAQLTRAISQLVVTYQTRCDYNLAIFYARRWLTVDPIDENAHRFLIQALAASGQRSLALRQYQDCSRILKTELGVQPSEETKQLYQRIRVETEGVLSSASAATQLTLRSRTGLNNLPAPLTSFIGREKERADLAGLLTGAATRLVTLLGPGGIGKTRLALRVADEVLSGFEQGVFLVDLAPLVDPSHLAQTIALALEIRESEGRPYEEVLAQFLSDRSMLLVLDNCEHLATSCAHLVEYLLSRCPKLVILATSRESLQVQGEALYPLPALSCPSRRQLSGLADLNQFEAVQLFVKRAALVSPGFSLSAENAAAIALVCQRLDGIPLALELAAARVNLLSVEQIAARLEDCFHLLVSARRKAISHHQTMKACLDWSYDLLSPAEQTLLRRLSVFSEGWNLDAAEAVCAQEAASISPIPASSILDLLSSLINKSMVSVRMVSDRQPGLEKRYYLLEPIRQYTLAKLEASGERPALRDRHLDFFTQFSELYAPRLRSQEQLPILSLMEPEQDNLLAAMRWALVDGIPAAQDTLERTKNGLRMAIALYYFNELSGFPLNISWLAAGLSGLYEKDLNSLTLRARTLFVLAMLTAWEDIHLNNANRKSIQISKECIALLRECGDKVYLSQALVWLAWMTQGSEEAAVLMEEGVALAHHSEEPWIMADAIWCRVSIVEKSLAIPSAQESLALFRETGDPWKIHWALTNFGGLLVESGQYTDGYACLQESTRFFQERGLQSGLVYANHCMGTAAYYLEDYKQMAACFADALELNRQIGTKGFSTSYLRLIGTANKHLADFSQSSRYYLESILTAQRYGETQGMCMAISGLAGVAARSEQPILAVNLLSAASAVLETLHETNDPIAQIEVENDTALAWAKLSENAFEKAWVKGRTMSLEDALREARLLVEELSGQPAARSD